VFLGRSGGDIGEAYLEVLDIEWTPEGEQFIPLKYHFPFGNRTSIDESSALVKPFKKLMDDGRPTGKIAFVFYRENGVDFVLGSFAFTERIIFFPGISFSRIVLDSNGGEYMDNEIDLDHLTLERDFIKWHFKPTQKNKRFETQRTKRVKNDTFLWFVMGIPSVSKLEPMPMTQVYQLKAPQKGDEEGKVRELNRRREGMLDSVDDSKFPFVEIKYNPTGNYFLNFEVLVSRRKTREMDIPDGVYCIPPPSSKEVGVAQGIKCIDDFSTSESLSITVRASHVTGTLTKDAFFYSGNYYL
jgi:hypothetical protein